MGALTLKSFPFELRGWDIEKFNSIDPTDSFGSNTRVYVSNQRIIQIEPEYSINNSNNWLSDKGRQFFDGILETNNQTNRTLPAILKKKSIFKSLIKTFYLFEYCVNKQTNYFTILFENVNIEILSLLIILSYKYSFINIKRLENVKLNNDLESNFQLNSPTGEKKLYHSNLCILIGCNTRYESYSLNLKLRQRFLKGNFKCLNLGSLINLTFPSNFIGTNLNILKTLIEGNSFICQDLKSSCNPFLIFNNELFQRADGSNILKIIKILKYTNLFNKILISSNILNFSIYETGIQNINNFKTICFKDLININSLYLINTNLENIKNFKSLIETKLLNYNNFLNHKQIKINNFLIDQNYFTQQNLNFYKTKFNNFNAYFHLSTKMFYENNELLINTEGSIRHTSKIISKKNSKSNWKLLRSFFKTTKNHFSFLSKKENFILNFNSKKQTNFKNFIIFNYYVSKKLENVGFLLNSRNKSFYLNNKILLFKFPKLKLINTKVKYWLDDFFVGGKDDYSQKSLLMTNCSKILRNQSTNFF